MDGLGAKHAAMNGEQNYEADERVEEVFDDAIKDRHFICSASVSATKAATESIKSSAIPVLALVSW